MNHSLRIVLISDTHGFHEIAVPPGDVLIHAGDGCRLGTLEEAEAWTTFLAGLPHRHKLAIAGNHDRVFETDLERAAGLMAEAGVTFLHDSGCSLEGLPVWGSPWQPRFFDWAFNLDRGPALAAKWALIPDDTDILITHGPAHGILDGTYDGRLVGCEAMRAELQRRVRPRLHVFGHIHEGYGVAEADGTLHVNACTCTMSYQPTNPAIVVDLPLDRSRPARAIEPA